MIDADRCPRCDDYWPIGGGIQLSFAGASWPVTAEERPLRFKVTSYFDQQDVCRACFGRELHHPRFEEARIAELHAMRRKDCIVAGSGPDAEEISRRFKVALYAGVGVPADLRPPARLSP